VQRRNDRRKPFGLLNFAVNLGDFEARTQERLCRDRTVNMTGRVPMGVDTNHAIGEADEGSLTHTHTSTQGQATNRESQGSVAQDPHPGGGQPVGQAGHTHPLSGIVTDPQSSLLPVTRVYFIQKIT
jgi:hypothetical protein